MRRRLSPEEEEQRLELYKKGLTDREIAENVGCSPATICSWRRYHKLQANIPRGKIRGVPMEKALTPRQCIIMRRFLYDLLGMRNICGEIDIGTFLREYRRYLSGIVRVDRRRLQDGKVH